MADLSDMADDRILRSQLRRRVFRAILALAGDLPGAGHAPRYSGDVDRRGERHASRERSDAQVAPAPRPVDSAEAACRLRRRPDAPPAALRVGGSCSLPHLRPHGAGGPTPARLRVPPRIAVPCMPRPTHSIIALSSATRSTTLNAGIITSTIPPRPSLTGSAAARVRTPA